jgi:hypothetical protein
LPLHPGGLLASRVALAASRVQHMRMLITMDPDTKLPDLGGRTVHTWQDLLAKTEPLADIDSRIAAQNSDDTLLFCLYIRHWRTPLKG